MEQPPFYPLRGGGQETSLTLLNKLQQGLPEAWVRLNDLYHPLICFWCLQSGVLASDVDDVCQEVYRVVLVKPEVLHRNRPGDSLRGWLRAITKMIILEHFRRNRKHPPGEGGTDANIRLQELPAAAPEDDDPPEQVEQLAQRALALIRVEFSPRDNRVFDLMVMEEMTAKSVAAEFAMTPENVRKIKSRILYRIRQELGDA